VQITRRRVASAASWTLITRSNTRLHRQRRTRLSVIWHTLSMSTPGAHCCHKLNSMRCTDIDKKEVRPVPSRYYYDIAYRQLYPEVRTVLLLWRSIYVSRSRRRAVPVELLRASLWSCRSSASAIISFYWSRDVVSAHSAVGLLLWLARRSGTHWQMNCELRPTQVIGLKQLWRLSSSLYLLAYTTH